MAHDTLIEARGVSKIYQSKDGPVESLTPLDFSLSDEEIKAATKTNCEKSPGFELIAAWRARFASKMQKFAPPK